MTFFQIPLTDGNLYSHFVRNKIAANFPVKLLNEIHVLELEQMF